MRKKPLSVIAGVFVIVSLLMSPKAFALGGYATLSGDSKTVADAIKTNLEISENVAFDIYDKYIKTFLNSPDWHYDIFHNGSLASSKVDKSDVKIFHFNLVNTNRLVNITMTKYSKEKQILIQSIETLPRQSQIVIDKYNELKKDKEFVAGYDKDSFSVFKKDGYTEKVKVLTVSGAGAVQYIDFILYDLKN